MAFGDGFGSFFNNIDQIQSGLGELSSFTDKLTQSLSGLNDMLGGLDQQANRMTHLGNVTSRLNTHIEKLSKNTGELKGGFSKGSGDVDKLTDSYGKLSDAIGDLSDDTGGFLRESKNLRAGLQQVYDILNNADAAEEYKDELYDITSAVEKLISYEKQLDSQLKKTGKVVSETPDEFKAVNAETVKTIQLIQRIIGIGGVLENNYREIGNAVGLSADQMGVLSNALSNSNNALIRGSVVATKTSSAFYKLSGVTKDQTVGALENAASGLYSFNDVATKAVGKIDKLSSETQGLAAGFDDVSEDVDKFYSQLDSNDVSGASQTYEKIEKVMSGFSKTVNHLSESLVDLSGDIKGSSELGEKADTVYDGLRGTIDVLNNKYNDVSKSVVQAKNAINEVVDAGKKGADGLGKTTDEIDELGDEADETERKIKELADTIEGELLKKARSGGQNVIDFRQFRGEAEKQAREKYVPQGGQEDEIEANNRMMRSINDVVDMFEKVGKITKSVSERYNELEKHFIALNNAFQSGKMDGEKYIEGVEKIDSRFNRIKKSYKELRQLLIDNKNLQQEGAVEGIDARPMFGQAVEGFNKITNQITMLRRISDEAGVHYNNYLDGVARTDNVAEKAEGGVSGLTQQLDLLETAVKNVKDDVKKTDNEIDDLDDGVSNLSDGFAEQYNELSRLKTMYDTLKTSLKRFVVGGTDLEQVVGSVSNNLFFMQRALKEDNIMEYNLQIEKLKENLKVLFANVGSGNVLGKRVRDVFSEIVKLDSKLDGVADSLNSFGVKGEGAANNVSQGVRVANSSLRYLANGIKSAYDGVENEVKESAYEIEQMNREIQDGVKHSVALRSALKRVYGVKDISSGGVSGVSSGLDVLMGRGTVGSGGSFNDGINRLLSGVSSLESKGSEAFVSVKEKTKQSAYEIEQMNRKTEESIVHAKALANAWDVLYKKKQAGGSDDAAPPRRRGTDDIMGIGSGTVTKVQDAEDRMRKASVNAKQIGSSIWYMADGVRKAHTFVKQVFSETAMGIEQRMHQIDSAKTRVHAIQQAWNQLYRRGEEYAEKVSKPRDVTGTSGIMGRDVRGGGAPDLGAERLVEGKVLLHLEKIKDAFKQTSKEAWDLDKAIKGSGIAEEVLGSLGTKTNIWGDALDNVKSKVLGVFGRSKEEVNDMKFSVEALEDVFLGMAKNVGVFGQKMEGFSDKIDKSRMSPARSFTGIDDVEQSILGTIKNVGTLEDNTRRFLSHARGGYKELTDAMGRGLSSELVDGLNELKSHGIWMSRGLPKITDKIKRLSDALDKGETGTNEFTSDLVTSKGDLDQMQEHVMSSVKTLKLFKDTIKGTGSEFDDMRNHIDQQIATFEQYDTVVSNLVRSYGKISKLRDDDKTMGGISGFTRMADTVGSKMMDLMVKQEKFSDSLSKTAEVFNKTGHKSKEYKDQLNKLVHEYQESYKELGVLRSALNRYETAAQEAEVDTDELGDEIQRVTDFIDNYEKELSFLNTVLNETGSITDKTSKKIKDIGSVYKKTSGEAEALGGSLGGGGGGGSAGGARGGVGGALDRLRYKVKQNENDFSVWGVRAYASIEIAQRLYRSFERVTESVTEFELAMARVSGITGAVGPEFERLSRYARDVGESTIFTAVQTAEAMEELARLGQTTTQVIATLPSVLEVAAAEQMKLADASRLVAVNLNAFELRAEEASRVGNALAAASMTSAATMKDFGISLRTTAAFAHKANISIEQLLALTAKLTDAGMTPYRGGVAIRALIEEMQKPVAKGAVKELDRMGLTLNQINPKVVGFTKALSTLREAVIQSGTNIRNVFELRASHAFEILSRVGGAAIDNYTESITGTNDASRLAARQMDTLYGSMQRLKSVFQELQISLGFALMPMIRGTVDGLASMTRGVTGLGDGTKSAIAYTATFAGGFLFLLQSISFVRYGLNLFQKQIADFGTILEDSVLKKLKNVRLLGMNPWVIGIIAAVAAIGTLIIVINKWRDANAKRAQEQRDALADEIRSREQLINKLEEQEGIADRTKFSKSDIDTINSLADGLDNLSYSFTETGRLIVDTKKNLDALVDTMKAKGLESGILRRLEDLQKTLGKTFFTAEEQMSFMRLGKHVEGVTVEFDKLGRAIFDSTANMQEFMEFHRNFIKDGKLDLNLFDLESQKKERESALFEISRKIVPNIGFDEFAEKHQLPEERNVGGMSDTQSMMRIRQVSDKIRELMAAGDESALRKFFVDITQDDSLDELYFKLLAIDRQIGKLTDKRESFMGDAKEEEKTAGAVQKFVAGFETQFDNLNTEYTNIRRRAKKELMRDADALNRRYLEIYDSEIDALNKLRDVKDINYTQEQKLIAKIENQEIARIALQMQMEKRRESESKKGNADQNKRIRAQIKALSDIDIDDTYGDLLFDRSQLMAMRDAIRGLRDDFPDLELVWSNAIDKLESGMKKMNKDSAEDYAKGLTDALNKAVHEGLDILGIDAIEKSLSDVLKIRDAIDDTLLKTDDGSLLQGVDDDISTKVKGLVALLVARVEHGLSSQNLEGVAANLDVLSGLSKRLEDLPIDDVDVNESRRLIAQSTANLISASIEKTVANVANITDVGRLSAIRSDLESYIEDISGVEILENMGLSHDLIKQANDAISSVFQRSFDANVAGIKDAVDIIDFNEARRKLQSNLAAAQEFFKDDQFMLDQINADYQNTLTAIDEGASGWLSTAMKALIDSGHSFEEVMALYGTFIDALSVGTNKLKKELEEYASTASEKSNEDKKKAFIEHVKELGSIDTDDPAKVKEHIALIESLGQKAVTEFGYFDSLAEYFVEIQEVMKSLMSQFDEVKDNIWNEKIGEFVLSPEKMVADAQQAALIKEYNDAVMDAMKQRENFNKALAEEAALWRAGLLTGDIKEGTSLMDNILNKFGKEDWQQKMMEGRDYEEGDRIKLSKRWRLRRKDPITEFGHTIAEVQTNFEKFGNWLSGKDKETDEPISETGAVVSDFLYAVDRFNLIDNVQKLGGSFANMDYTLTLFRSRLDEAGSTSNVFNSIVKRFGGSMEGTGKQVHRVMAAFSGIPSAIQSGLGVGGTLASVAGGGLGAWLGGAQGAAFGASIANSIYGLFSGKDDLEDEVTGEAARNKASKGSKLQVKNTHITIHRMTNKLEATIYEEADLEKLVDEMGLMWEQRLAEASI